ncbi:TrkH family potassium uptake protein [Paenirhodobacter populi]|uniref:Trk system potassium uptake protein n=1 Tax=Paenirhodobacter populi TaxID=2306993 RepID=A0A443JME8_9RHOB|nr:TrkH family potassium uptake protein [Sinirhodobacter populi]RWR21688.1 TrkH family potassium uptake protein [Sinirhodobacter populi]
MPDFGPVFHLLGVILLFLGITMIGPVALDFYDGSPNAANFAQVMLETMLFGGLLALAGRSGGPRALTLRQAYVLTVSIWICIPAFGALPFMQGAPHARFTDAYFEAVSGITGTGFSVFAKVESLPRSVVLWRSMLNWIGGLGIAFVAMVFLPVMRIGGMRYFQIEGFDTFGKIMPRAKDIARSLLEVYSILSLACMMAYLLCGLSFYDAVVHAMSTISMGGFASHDASFAVFPPAAQYAGTVFMLLSAMPFVRFIQLARGQGKALWFDVQVRAMLRWYACAVVLVIIYRLWRDTGSSEQIIRETAFNIASMMTGTGLAVAPIEPWGSFVMVVAFIVGMIGGCTGSTSAALSVFRVQVVLSVMKSAIQQMYAPHRVVQPRYGGKPLDENTIGSLMQYVTAYIMTLGICAVLISLDGADMTSALFAAWGALGNIGYAIGPIGGPTGTMVGFGTSATWIMTAAMLLGRLGLMAFFVLFLPRFWRD